MKSVFDSQLRFRLFVIVFIIFIAAASTLLRVNRQVLAAPVNQTVPLPTVTPADTPVPTATPVPDNDNDNDDNDPAPTATPTPIPPTATPEGYTATVSVVRLNVRQGPSTEFSVLGVVTNGQQLQVLARNDAGDWWQICCIANTNTAGWVSAQFVQSSFDRTQANTLLPLADTLPTPPPTPSPTATLDPTIPTPTLSPDRLLDGVALQLQLQQDPLYTWQGESVDLVYNVANVGTESALNVELRNELPVELSFVDFVDIGAGTAMTETTATNTVAYAITWPELASGETETIRVRVAVTDTVADGVVLNNLAVITADDSDAVTAGLSIGMPPVALPEFQ